MRKFVIAFRRILRVGEVSTQRKPGALLRQSGDDFRLMITQFG